MPRPRWTRTRRSPPRLRRMPWCSPVTCPACSATPLTHSRMCGERPLLTLTPPRWSWQGLPALEAAYAGRPRDESLLADLLHSEAALHGPAAALERFERYRSGLREELGTDPGELLQRAHRDLLALDRPVRRGVRYDATALV